MATPPTADYKKIALQGMECALKKMTETDTFQTFGNFVAEELRKIPKPCDAHVIQRKIQRVLLEYWDNLEGSSTANSDQPELWNFTMDSLSEVCLKLNPHD